MPLTLDKAQLCTLLGEGLAEDGRAPDPAPGHDDAGQYRGLRRRGFDETAIQALREAYRCLYRQELSLDRALGELDRIAGEVSEVAGLIACIKSLL